MRAFGSSICDIQKEAGGQFMLDIEVPLLHVPIAYGGRGVSCSAAVLDGLIEGGVPNRGIQGLLQSARKGIVQSADGRNAAVQGGYKHRAGAVRGVARRLERAADGQFRNPEDSMASAKDRPFPDLVREAEARRELKLIQVPGIAAPTKAGADKPELALQGETGLLGKRILRREVPKSQAVVPFGPWAVLFVPQSEVQSEPFGYLPGISEVDSAIALLTVRICGFRSRAADRIARQIGSQAIPARFIEYINDFKVRGRFHLEKYISGTGWRSK
jgi:hypothetical protein